MSMRHQPGDLALSADEVRRLTLYSQGFLGVAAKRGGVSGVLRRIGAVQLDTISVLARSHELVAYARLGPIGRSAVETAYWPATKPKTFEYWAHAACILPIEDWPYYAWRRRAITARGQRWHQVSERACDRGAGAAARRGAADRDPARRGEGGRAVVGLVRGEDRGRVAARHRPGRLRAPRRLAAGLRPARAGRSRAAARPASDRCGVPGLPGRRRPPARSGWPPRPI